jgi:hypothetical protein
LIKSTVSLAILLAVSSSVAFGAVDTSYEAITLGEIENIRKIELEKKKIEVLARLQMLSASNIQVNSESNSYSRARNSTKSSHSMTQTTEVS